MFYIMILGTHKSTNDRRFSWGTYPFVSNSKQSYLEYPYVVKDSAVSFLKTLERTVCKLYKAGDVLLKKILKPTLFEPPNGGIPEALE